MTISEIASLISAMAALLAAFASLHNTRKIREVHDATNGMKHELVEAVRTGSLAKGKAEGLAQGRSEHGTTDSSAR